LFFLFKFLFVLAFFGFSLLSCYFRPFTGVLRKIFGFLTQKVCFAAERPRITRILRIGFEQNEMAKNAFGFHKQRFLNRVVAFCWPRNRIEEAIANTQARASPQTEKQSAATQWSVTADRELLQSYAGYCLTMELPTTMPVLGSVPIYLSSFPPAKITKWRRCSKKVMVPVPFAFTV
jgi:hypothetical protein